MGFGLRDWDPGGHSLAYILGNTLSVTLSFLICKMGQHGNVVKRIKVHGCKVLSTVFGKVSDSLMLFSR